NPAISVSKPPRSRSAVASRSSPAEKARPVPGSTNPAESAARPRIRSAMAGSIAGVRALSFAGRSRRSTATSPARADMRCSPAGCQSRSITGRWYAAHDTMPGGSGLGGAAMLILSRTEVESLLDLDRLVDALAVAMVALSGGRAPAPPGVAPAVADRHAMLAAMPAYLPSSGALATKLVSVFPENADRPTHQAIICCFDPASGAPVAIMDGTHVTAARTAAGAMLATRLLARRGAGVVSVIGTGVQAQSHARAAARLPGVQVVQIAGRHHPRAKGLVDGLRETGTAGAAPPSIGDAVRSADVVCAATPADEPVVPRGGVRPGPHVTR